MLVYEAFQGGYPIWCQTRSCAHLKAQPRAAYSRSVTYPLWRGPRPVAPSDPSCETAARRCVAAAGGKGSQRVPVRALDEAFQGDYSHMVVLPSALSRQPEKLNRDWRIQQVHHASRVPAGPGPVAPCDPASGSRAGGALRRLGEGSGGHWARLRVPNRGRTGGTGLSAATGRVNYAQVALLATYLVTGDHYLNGRYVLPESWAELLSGLAGLAPLKAGLDLSKLAGGVGEGLVKAPGLLFAQPL